MCVIGSEDEVNMNIKMLCGARGEWGIVIPYVVCPGDITVCW